MIKNRFSYQANALGQTLAKRFAMVLTMLFLIGAVQVFGEEATLTFDNTSKRTIFTTNQQVWEENGIIFTNNKDKSSSNVADYSKPVRCYKNSEIIINCNSLGNIYQIVFKCTSSEYANHLKNSIAFDKAKKHWKHCVSFSCVTSEIEIFSISRFSNCFVNCLSF